MPRERDPSGCCKLSAAALILATALSACATTQYTPLAQAEKEDVEQLKDNVFRVEYRVSAFTPQERLDHYLTRRCAELTVREGYDYFHLGQRFDVLMASRRTSMTVTMFKGELPGAAPGFYDAKAVLIEADGEPQRSPFRGGPPP